MLSSRIDNTLSPLGQNSPVLIKSSSILSGVNNEVNNAGIKASQVSGLLSKNISASLALSDSHHELASIDIAKQAIKETVGGLLEIQKIIKPQLTLEGSKISPEKSSQLLFQQRKISNAVETRFDDNRVLDATLSPQTKTSNSIPFQIEGLDLIRSRWESELVTLQLDGEISLLMFEAGKSDEELITQFNKALGFAKMSIEKNDDSQLIISMDDAKWRESSKVVNITGQGHRFPSGQFIPTNISSIKADITAFVKVPLDMNSQTLNAVNSFIGEAQFSYQALNLARNKEVMSSASYLDQYKIEADPFEPKISTIIEEKKWASLFNVRQNHASISRKTVVDLLK
ncbi:hypothetical protein [Psychromonas sp. Urea-02u-13]|uniref:hypothetical protein n=1 Tax=Psychromonas sp. Urea-02u-13 TaxID=2058326 RepID=UPI000C348BF8|nr:hypothetical protein [Psychromonas sp. Urea-02u-13]PKG39545.1 hypothetical protein CXF74_07725 [Psychromonas sp. Urea-02u-13]